MAENFEIYFGTALPPPRSEKGVAGWVRANLLSTWYNGVLTVASTVVLGTALWFGVRWLIFDSDWTVIGTLGGRLVIGQYNIESACPGQNCFWRPQVALLLVTALLGMAWRVAGGGLTRRVAIGVAVALSAFALLPYSLERMGMGRTAAAVGQPARAGGRMGYGPLRTAGNGTVGHSRCGRCVRADSAAAAAECQVFPVFSRCLRSTGVG